jgi:large subunit ribosomal protein L17
MRHRYAGRHLNRTSSHRSAMRRNMAVSLFQHGAIRTTEPKAKELRRFVEKLITHAKKNTLHARRMVISALGRDRAMYDTDEEPMDKTVVQKLFDEIAPKYADRPGGYTRIIRLAERRIGDAGSQVILQLVEEATSGGEDERSGRSRRRRRASKRHTAAAEAEPKAAEKPADEETPADEADSAAAEDSADEQAEAEAPADETKDDGDEEKK